jgi:ribosomal protein S18 acetylase RimI-like enzyme
MLIRPFCPSDRNRLQQIVNSTDNFNQADRDVAMELIEDVILRGQASDYIIDVLEDEEGVVQAYVCFGHTPLTANTFDFYWMVIDPEHQRRGFGYLLFQHVENEVRAKGGRLLMCETSSLEGYERVLRLYEKLGYQFVARIRNFYREGDDKLIYMKELA